MADLTLKVPAIEKLMDYAASGIGAVAGPMLAPWRTGREGKARIIAACADAEVRRISEASNARSLGIIADAQAKARQSLIPSSDQVAGAVEIRRDDVYQRIEFQEQKRLANISSVVTRSASELNGKAVPDHDPDPDWNARFVNYVQDVSSDDMQRIWARLLSGEVESPGRTSLRTLDTLSKMVKKDAEAFRDMCDFVIGDDGLFYEETGHPSDNKHNFEAISFANILHLQDCNLISVEPGLAIMIELEGLGEHTLGYQNDGLMIMNRRKSNVRINMPVVRLTSSGANLYSFVQCNAQMEYLRAFATFLNGLHCDLDYLKALVLNADGSVDFESRLRIDLA